MQNKNRKTEFISLFIVALFVGSVGLYTENNGFLVAGIIFLLISILLSLATLE